MRATVEREIKLVPGDEFVMPEIGERRPTRAFVTTYHDTSDFRLTRHGITLRHRVEDGVGAWQLKLPRGAARLELEAPGPPTQPPSGLLGLLVAHLRDRELVPIARLRTRREVRLADGAEIVDDTVSVMDGLAVVDRFREVEVELLDGDEQALTRLRDALVQAGAVAGRSSPKLHRALKLDVQPMARRAVAIGTPPADALGIALEQEYLHLMAHDPGARRGDDPEDVHQLRVAVRRLRAFLRAGGPLLDAAWVDLLRTELRWLGSMLGPARDLDVMLERLEDDARALGPDAAALGGLRARLEAERAVAYAAVRDALGGERYFAILGRLEGSAAPPLSGAADPLAEAWRRELRRLRRAVAQLGPEPADDDLHASRIAVKRARYSTELAAHELGPAAAGFVAAAKQLQDVLGEHQDACFYEAKVRQWLALAPSGGFAAGRLVERARQRRSRARAAWPSAWRRLERRARRVRR